MSIGEEITRLQSAKSDLKNAIEEKGGQIPDDTTLDVYATILRNIPPIIDDNIISDNKTWSSQKINDSVLLKSGGTMTGELILAGETTNANGAVTKSMLDAISGGAELKELKRFTASGTFQKANFPSVNNIYIFLMVGGGGGISNNSSGRSGSITTMIYRMTQASVKVTIGAGGTSGDAGGNTYIGANYVTGQGALGGGAGRSYGVMDDEENITGYGKGAIYNGSASTQSTSGVCIVYGFQ